MCCSICALCIMTHICVIMQIRSHQISECPQLQSNRTTATLNACSKCQKCKKCKRPLQRNRIGVNLCQSFYLLFSLEMCLMLMKTVCVEQGNCIEAWIKLFLGKGRNFERGEKKTISRQHSCGKLFFRIGLFVLSSLLDIPRYSPKKLRQRNNIIFSHCTHRYEKKYPNW